MKKTPAIIAALIITLLIGLSMLGIGYNALMNTAAVNASSPTTVIHSSTSAGAAGAPASDQQQIQDLQSLIQQYQSREAQYQSELKQAAQDVNTANQLALTSSSQAQNYQQILNQLQQAGLIKIDSNGQITIKNLNQRTRPSSNGG